MQQVCEADCLSPHIQRWRRLTTSIAPRGKPFEAMDRFAYAEQLSANLQWTIGTRPENQCW